MTSLWRFDSGMEQCRVYPEISPYYIVTKSTSAIEQSDNCKPYKRKPQKCQKNAERLNVHKRGNVTIKLEGPDEDSFIMISL